MVEPTFYFCVLVFLNAKADYFVFNQLFAGRQRANFRKEQCEFDVILAGAGVIEFLAQ